MHPWKQKSLDTRTEEFTHQSLVLLTFRSCCKVWSLNPANMHMSNFMHRSHHHSSCTIRCIKQKSKRCPLSLFRIDFPGLLYAHVIMQLQQWGMPLSQPLHVFSYNLQVKAFFIMHMIKFSWTNYPFLNLYICKCARAYFKPKQKKHWNKNK